MTFADLGLSPETLKAVDEVGYNDPTPIQAQAIPPVLMGRDVLGIAQTGTGKTASFTLPMIDILASGRPKARMPRSLILAPTRELATQVSENFTLYGKYHKLTMALLIGGESMKEQQAILDRGVDVLIATPGRLIDLFERGAILLRDVKILVIDEADRMLDMGFIPDVERIVGLLPPLRQTLFFSATMDPEIKRLADAFLMNPKEIRVEPTRKAADTVEQGLVTVKAFDKREALRHLLRREEVTTAFIFCNRKRDVDVLERSLKKHGFDAVALHGDMPQYVRTERLEKFKQGEIQLLVCSDVAARGIDVTEISHVFNFDVPSHAEDYIHRIGRTGRAGKTGRAFTIATPEDAKYLRSIQNLLGKPIPPTVLEELDQAALNGNGNGNGAGESEGDGPSEGKSDRGNRRSRGRGRGRDRDRKPTEAQTESATEETPEATPAPAANGGNGGGNGNGGNGGSNGSDRGNGGRDRDRGGRKSDRSSGRGRRRGRWEDDPQNEVMEMDIADDAIGFGGFTPAFLLEEPVFSLMDPNEDDESEGEGDIEAEAEAPPPAKEEKPKRKRAPRRKKVAEEAPTQEEGASEESASQEGTTEDATSEEAAAEATPEPVAEEAPAPEAEVAPAPEGETEAEAAPVEEKPKRKRAPRKKKVVEETPATETEAEAAPAGEGEAEAAPVEEKPKRKRAPRKKKVVEETPATEAAAEAAPAGEGEAEAAPVEEKPKRKRAPRKRVTKAEAAPAEEAPAPEAAPEAAPQAATDTTPEAE